LYTFVTFMVKRSFFAFEVETTLATVVLHEGAHMPTLVAQPTRISAAGTKPKLIDEYIGRVNTKTTGVSVAHMRSPQGWEEPGQTPEFDEFTLVLKGMVRVQHEGGQMDVMPGQAIIAHGGEWIQYSTPAEGGAEYIAVCLPAFSMDTVHRDE
jgi:mannose-6-phosphate isomerase-like protein (cupin superfamily)